MANQTNIEQLFVEWSGLIRNNVAKNIVTSDFYLKYLPKEPWVDGQGTAITYPVYERTLPTNPVTFSAWQSSGGDGVNNPGQNADNSPFASTNVNASSTDTLGTNGSASINNQNSGAATGTLGGGSYSAGSNIDSFGVTLRTASLKKAALNSPNIDLNDLQFAWQVEDQVKNVIRVLSENTKYVWTNAYQDEYIAACGAKIIAAPNLPEGTTSFPTTAPTSRLTWGILEYIYERLGYNGGSINPFMRVDETTPVFAVVGERWTFRDLLMDDQNVRQDFRFAYQGDSNDKSNPLLAAPGLNGVYRGFKFFNIELPPRYDLVTGAWVRRYPYSPLATTRGDAWEVQSAYKSAAYTDTAVYHQDVLKILIPKPKVSGGGMTYNPQYSWTGEFVWRNIPDRTSNIDGSIGFFRALYGYGPKVERPDLGFVVRHQRAPRGISDLVPVGTADASY